MGWYCPHAAKIFRQLILYKILLKNLPRGVTPG